MKHALVANRYAKALSAAIADADQLDMNLEALDKLSEMFAEFEQLRRVLNDPAIPKHERLGGLEALLKRVDAPPAIHNTLILLLRRGRISLLPKVAELFRRRVDERCGWVTANVTTAVPLTAQQAEPLRIGLQKFVGRDVRMHQHVDEAIVGGVIAEIAGVIVDDSVRKRLKRISRALIENEDLLMN